MSYWVYENWRAESKAVIHHCACGYCNNGNGFHRNIHGNRNGQWHGPLPTYEEAMEKARSTGRPVKHCPNKDCR